MSKDKMEMPTKAQILETANACPQAKDALAKLFPKAFEGDKEWRELSYGDIEVGQGSHSGCFFLREKDHGRMIGYIKSLATDTTGLELETKLEFHTDGRVDKIFVRNK